MRGGTQEIYEKSVKISEDPTKIRNSSVTNTSLQRYRFTHLPSKKGTMDKRKTESIDGRGIKTGIVTSIFFNLCYLLVARLWVVRLVSIEYMYNRGNIWKEAALVWSMYYPRICLEVLGRCPVRNSNRQLPEYKSRALPLRQPVRREKGRKRDGKRKCAIRKMEGEKINTLALL